MSASAATLIGDAFAELNVYLPGESPSASDGALALRILNRMMGQWAQTRGTIPTVSRETFALTANKGGPSNPYTVGLTGNLVTDRPPNQQSVQGAGLLLNTSSPAVEIPRSVLTDDAWQAIQVKELTSTLFTSVYYNPSYASNLGMINLWPVPDNATHSLVLYLARPISAFANTTTVYDFPQGYEEAIVTNLAIRLQTPFGRQASAELKDQAKNSLALLKRVNLPLSDLYQDLFVRNHSGYYNIQTGQGGA